MADNNELESVADFYNFGVRKYQDSKDWLAYYTNEEGGEQVIGVFKTYDLAKASGKKFADDQRTKDESMQEIAKPEISIEKQNDAVGLLTISEVETLIAFIEYQLYQDMEVMDENFYSTSRAGEAVLKHIVKKLKEKTNVESY